MNSLKKIASDHWLAIPLFVTTTFAFGYQAIPFFVWLFIPIVLIYARSYKSYYRIFTVYIITSAALVLGYLGTLRMDSDGPAFPFIPTVIGATLLTNAILMATLFADQYTIKNSQCVYTRVFLFPTVWTSLWFFNSKFGFLGDYPAFSTSLTHWADFSQAASLGGRATLDFLIALTGTVSLELDTYPFQLLLSSKNNAIQEDISEKSPVMNKKSSKGKRSIRNDNAKQNKCQWIKLVAHPVSIYAIIMACVLTYGGAIVNIRRGSFYQSLFNNFVPESTPVGCVVGPAELYPDPKWNHNVWFNKTVELAEAGAKLVLWSEITTNVNDEKDEREFIEKTRRLATEHNIYIAATYRLLEPILQDRLILVTKEGELGIDYSKSHTVPGLEPDVAGPNVLQYVDTEEFGRIGAGICFDYSFGDFAKQASEHKVDLMLQSGWTWSPIINHSQQGNAIRAIENGFTLFRCYTQGISGITEPIINGVFNQKVISNKVEKYIFYLPLQKRIATLYGYIGDSFSYLCILASLGLILNTSYKSRRDKQLSI